MFGDNVVVEHPDEGMLSVKVRRKSSLLSICMIIMREGEGSGVRNCG